MIFLHITLFMLAAAAMWWLSGFDAKVAGENRGRDFKRRAARCLATAILVSIFFVPNAVHTGYIFVPLVLIVPPTIGILWAGCVGEFFAHGFHRLIDHPDNREFDLNQSARNLDMVASLFKNGRNEEAMRLCERLKKSGDVSVLVLETMLARAGIQQAGFKKSKPLVEAYQFRSEGKFTEAEAVLQTLLVENPLNVDAAMMLMRLYAQDLLRTDKAAEVLRVLEKQPHVPPACLEYAQRSIYEWSRGKTAPTREVLPESVDELLASGYLGTAVEILEQKTAGQPRDFDSWLKLAEAHALHSGNFQRAEKVVQKMMSSRDFSAEQIQLAKARLKEWREAKPQGN